jgi:hypothetical protein
MRQAYDEELMDSPHDTPLDPDELASDAFAAGLVLISAAEVAALADALTPLLEQQSQAERWAIARTWLVSILQTFRTRPLSLASEPGALDLAALWRRACAAQDEADQVPLVRWRSILVLTGHLASWFDESGFGDTDLGLRAICTREWLIDVLDQVRANPIPLATGAQQLDTPALLRRRVEDWARNDRERRGGA